MTYDMSPKNRALLEKRRAYQRDYYAKNGKKKHPVKWHGSKQSWWMCPICGKGRTGSIKKSLCEPEVFAWMYGGRGCLKRISGKTLLEQQPEFFGELNRRYMVELKESCSAFLRVYCTQEELKKLLGDLLITELPAKLVVAGKVVLRKSYVSMQGAVLKPACFPMKSKIVLNSRWSE